MFKILRAIKDAIRKERFDDKFHFGASYATRVFRHREIQKAIEEGDPEKVVLLQRLIRATPLDKSWGDYDLIGDMCADNKVPTEGLNFINNVLLYSTAKISTWYLGHYTTDNTPDATWDHEWAYTGGTPKATELTNAQITGSARPSLTFGSASSSGVITASAVSSVTLEVGVSGLTIYGSTINSGSTIGGQNVGGILLSAAKYASAKSGLAAGDIIQTLVSNTVTSST